MKHVDLVESEHLHHLNECNLFLPLYSCKNYSFGVK